MRPLANMLLRLDIETHAHHDEADATWTDLTGRSNTPTDYMNQLVRVYGFEAPLEAALAYTPKLASFLDLRQRSRSGFIAQDLVTLGLRPSQVSSIPQCMIAPFASVAEALGWMYVSERATLLHDRVRHRLQDEVPQVAPALSYCSAYAGVVNERWAELGEVLDRVACSKSVGNRIIDAAHQAFRRESSWLHARSRAA